MSDGVIEATEAIRRRLLDLADQLDGWIDAIDAASDGAATEGTDHDQR